MPGKVLEKLIYNGEDVTGQVKNGVFSAPALARDAVLQAVYADAPAAPDDKSYGIGGSLTDADGNRLQQIYKKISNKSTNSDGIIPVSTNWNGNKRQSLSFYPRRGLKCRKKKIGDTDTLQNVKANRIMK